MDVFGDFYDGTGQFRTTHKEEYELPDPLPDDWFSQVVNRLKQHRQVGDSIVVNVPEVGISYLVIWGRDHIEVPKTPRDLYDIIEERIVALTEDQKEERKEKAEEWLESLDRMEDTTIDLEDKLDQLLKDGDDSTR